MKLPKEGTLQRMVLDCIDQSRCCDNRDLAVWIKRHPAYVGQAAWTLWRKGLVAREQRGVWHTKTNV